VGLGIEESSTLTCTFLGHRTNCRSIDHLWVCYCTFDFGSISLLSLDRSLLSRSQSWNGLFLNKVTDTSFRLFDCWVLADIGFKSLSHFLLWIHWSSVVFFFLKITTKPIHRTGALSQTLFGQCYFRHYLLVLERSCFHHLFKTSFRNFRWLNR